MSRDPGPAVADLLGDAVVVAATDLGGSDRSRVQRLLIDRAGVREPVVVKEYLSAGEGYVREAAGLAALPAGARAPRLLADSGAPPVVLMSDVGEGTDVADALLGRDPGEATDAVVGWARAVGEVHAVSTGRRERFGQELAARAGDIPVAAHAQAEQCAEAATILAPLAEQLGVEVPEGALDRLTGLADALPGGPEAHRLTPGDTCPDNNRRTADGVALLDFEGAQWRHVAWDAAYLIVPWPTCWCSWRLPAAVSARALEAYRAAARPGVPFVAEDAFVDAVELAATGWAFTSTALLLPPALRSDRKAPWPEPTPRRRERVLHRLGAAAGREQAPELAEFAGRLHRALVARWRDRELPLAPAYR